MAAPGLEKKINVTAELEKRLLPDLRRVAGEIVNQFPDVKANAWSSALGLAANRNAYDLGIDCLLSTAGADQADQFALSVVVSNLGATPLIQAEVCWGHPSGLIEAELFSSPVTVTSEVLDELEARLPLLYDALKKALKRGHPAEQSRGTR